jgi:Flp pilus assembly protein TadG
MRCGFRSMTKRSIRAEHGAIAMQFPGQVSMSVFGKLAPPGRDMGMFNRLRRLLRGDRGEEGFSAMEFAIVLPVLMLLILGAMDLSHAYYTQHIITTDSRDGARYAVAYTSTNNQPTSGQISTYVITKLNYNSFNFDSLFVTGSYSGTSPNKIATVTVQAKIYWWILGSLLPNPTQLTATTAMTVEGP